MAPYIGVAKNIGQICRGAAKFFFGSRTSRGVSRVGILKMFRGGTIQLFQLSGGGQFFRPRGGPE